MPPLGRPRTTTNQGSRPPVNELGVADPTNYGVSVNPLSGTLAPWRQFIDQVEYVPEMRWPTSVTTFDQMRTDSQLAALITAVMHGVTQLRFLISPNGARPELVTEIAQDLNVPIQGKEDEPMGRMKKRFSHQRFCSQAMLAVLYGHMYFEQVGNIVDGKWRLRKLAPRMPQTIRAINVAEDGGLVSIQQWGTNQILGGQGIGIPPEIPVDRLAAFVFQQEGYSWVGRSMMRDCFKDWVIKDRLMRIEAINHERAGGVPYANAPQGATVKEIEDLDQLMRQFKIGESSGMALPFGADLNIAKGMNSDIDKTIKRYNESMARKFMMMVANLAQGGQHVGSYALGDIFDDLWHIAQRAVAQWYCDIVNEHIIEDIVDWNYGEDEELVPKLTWERTREDSLGVADLSLLVERGVIIVDDEIENAVRYKYQLPKRTDPRPDYAIGPGATRQPPENTPPVKEGDTKAWVQAGAPSSETPAPTRASIWQRLTGRSKPDVMASDGPVLVTVPNVEILHAGIEYNLSTGPTTFTPEDLRDAVMAANEDPSIPTPRLKLGHIDPRFNDASMFDATPAFGKATNLRLSENGMSIYADYVGVPKWLADIMATAYPSRSIEGYWGVESQMGKKWRFVLSACSLLGVVWPGCTVLEDLPNYYGAEMPSDVQVIAAPVEATGGDPDKMKFFGRKDEEKTAASANLDDVRRAFYNQYIPENPDNFWWWIQAVLIDPNELVVEDDETGQLYKLTFESDNEGNITFGEPEPVRIDYIPDTREANKAAAAHVAATLAIGREVAASWNKREDSVLPTTTASGGAMDPKQIRERLGLAEDASDAEVQEALRELNAAAGVSNDGTQGDPAAHGGVTPAGTGVPEPGAKVTQEGETADDDPNNVVTASGVTIPKGMRLIDEATLETLKVGASAGLTLLEESAKEKREKLVAAAIGDGRIAPAAREHWLSSLETADKVGDKSMAASLEAMPKGLIPVELRELGHGGTGPDGVAAAGDLDPETVRGWSGALFPEVRQEHAREAALASGEALGRQRVTADASYRR